MVLLLVFMQLTRDLFAIAKFLLVISVKNALTDLVTLTFQPQTISFLGYPKVIPNAKFEHFGIFHFRVMLRTNKQTDRLKHPTHAN